ncbi:MAG: transglycosylase family protein [Actinomycetota bacterium]
MKRLLLTFLAGVVVGALLTVPLASPAHTRREWRIEWTATHPIPELRTDFRFFSRPVARAIRQVWRVERDQAIARMWQAFREAKAEWAAIEIAPPAPPPPPRSGRADWYAIAVCESGHNPPAWHINTLNPFWGGLQFLPSTWFAYGGGPFRDTGTNPFPYSAAEQIAVAERVLAGQGPQAWPHCFRWAA